LCVSRYTFLKIRLSTNKHMDRTNSESELKIKIVPTYTQLRYNWLLKQLVYGRSAKFLVIITDCEIDMNYT